MDRCGVGLYGGYATVTSAPPKRPAGRTKFQETRHPVYRGVHRRGAAGRWVCEVRQPNKKPRIWLGTFASPEAAARAHDVAALALRGRAACLNFSDSAALLCVDPATLRTPQDIRAAAIALARAACPNNAASSSAPAVQAASAPAPAMVMVACQDEIATAPYDDYTMQYGGMGYLDQHSYYYDGLGTTGRTAHIWTGTTTAPVTPRSGATDRAGASSELARFSGAPADSCTNS